MADSGSGVRATVRAVSRWPGSQAQLLRELNALGYQQGAPTTPAGTARKRTNRFIHPRIFISDAKEPAVKVSLAFDSERIQQMAGPSLVRLEPEQIGTLLPQSGEDRTLLAPSKRLLCFFRVWWRLRIVDFSSTLA